MTAPRRFKVTLVGDGGLSAECACDTTMTIAEALESAGLAARLACRSGGCGACVAWLREGGVRYLQPVSQAKLRACEAQGVDPVFLCRAAPQTDVLLRVPGITRRRNTTPLSALLNPPSDP